MKVLVVSDIADAPRRFNDLLRDGRQSVHQVSSVADALAVLAGDSYDVLLLDQRLERRDPAGSAALDRRSPLVTTLRFDGAALVDGAPLRKGADPNDDSCGRRATTFPRCALAHERARQAPRTFRDDAAYTEFIAVDPKTREMLATVRAIASVNSTVLITGETGTGKELVARCIHEYSARGRGAFIPVNCGGIPDTLVESELFGHRKGAFTGAATDRVGLIAEAELGVLFLDEIGEMPRKAQAALLRFFDLSEIRRVGDSAIRYVDTRILAATNCVLDDEVRAGRFRSDLLYRLNVITVQVPPLRERPADIVPLAQHHLARAAARLQKNVHGLSDGAIVTLTNHGWPGNIRELRNAIERAVVVATHDIVTERDLPDSLTSADARRTAPAPLEPRNLEQLLSTVDRFAGNRTHAAAALGISRTTLWRKLRTDRLAHRRTTPRTRWP